MPAVAHYEPEPEHEPSSAPAGQMHGHGQGLCAIVQFDYEVCSFLPITESYSLIFILVQALEDNEMNLTEGELIEQIEQLDEGWWSGVGDGGAKQGLFPGKLFPLQLVWCANMCAPAANYVQIVEQPEAAEAPPPSPPPPPPPPPAVSTQPDLSVALC